MLAGKNELVQNQLFLREATRFMRDEPGEAARLFVRKLGYFWWFSPHAGLLYPASWTALYMADYLVILGSAVVGLVAALRSARPEARWAARLFLLLAVTLSLTQAAFYVEGRHRWQLELILLAFTAAGIVKLSTGEPTASTPV